VLSEIILDELGRKPLDKFCRPSARPAKSPRFFVAWPLRGAEERLPVISASDIEYASLINPVAG
jgi:hypothetical protein